MNIINLIYMSKKQNIPLCKVVNALKEVYDIPQAYRINNVIEEIYSSYPELRPFQFDVSMQSFMDMLFGEFQLHEYQKEFIENIVHGYFHGCHVRRRY